MYTEEKRLFFTVVSCPIIAMANSNSQLLMVPVVFCAYIRCLRTAGEKGRHHMQGWLLELSIIGNCAPPMPSPEASVVPT
jgi:hypothetical protein